MNDSKISQALTSGEFMDNMIRLALVGVLVLLCFQVFNPFLGLMTWALVLAAMVYPVHQSLAARMGGRQGRASTVLVLAGFALLGVPIILLAGSFVTHIHGLSEAYQAGTLVLPAPSKSVADWPLIGNKVYAAWSAAAASLPDFVEANREALRGFSKGTLAATANTAKGVLGFLGSMAIAGIMMAYGEGGSRAIYHILCKVAGPVQGPRVHKLATMTTRSIAVGVLGVALIQALILGLGFFFSGIPAAGLLAVVVMLVGIMQLPALVISIPAIAYLWSAGDGSTVATAIWTVYLLVGGAADNVLKPLLLGRGVDAPMPVILLGALGGMATSGIIGLFLGAVLLAVGYQVFMQWVGDYADTEVPAAVPSATVSTEQTGP